MTTGSFSVQVCVVFVVWTSPPQTLQITYHNNNHWLQEYHFCTCVNCTLKLQSVCDSDLITATHEYGLIRD